jgi:polysaccharide export outer membrane protein
MRSIKRLSSIAAVAVACGFVATGQSTQTSAVRSTYLLGPDDQIVLHVSDAPELSDKPVRIDANGEIKLPMVGRVEASGLTPQQLEAELVRRLKVYLENPDVSVTVGELRSQPVSVIGAVGSPGLHQLEGHKTLIEILALAGGLRSDAGPDAKITRHLQWGRIPLPDAKDDSSGHFSVAQINLRSLMQAKNPEQNIAIFPEDVISVPQAEMVYVLGDVTKTGPVPLTEGDRMSVLEAVSTSGGVLRTASPGKAKILRPVSGSTRRRELPVDLKKIQAGQADDVQLLAGDILFVPGSTAKRASIRAAEAAIQVGAMAATYGMVR